MSRFSPNCVYSDRVWSAVDIIGSRKVTTAPAPCRRRCMATTGLRALQVGKVYRDLWSAYPDYTMHVEDVLARDDSNTVAVHFTCTGARSP